MKALCSACSKPLRKLDDATVHGFDHRTNEEVFTCRKCLLEVAARANLVLAYKVVTIPGFSGRARPLPERRALSEAEIEERVGRRGRNSRGATS